MIYGLLKKINNKPAVIGIIELGYVGLPLVIRFINEKYRKLNSSETYI
jgi:UDP-N-acetyl-D-glucosamine dehydrogenase